MIDCLGIFFAATSHLLSPVLNLKRINRSSDIRMSWFDALVIAKVNQRLHAKISKILLASLSRLTWVRNGVDDFHSFGWSITVAKFESPGPPP